MAATQISGLTFTAVSQDGTTSTITDAYVYSSPARNTLAVFLAAYKVSSSLQDTALTITSFTPATASAFTVTNDIDGRYKYMYVVVPRWLVGTVYNRYDLVYDMSTTAFYEYNNASPTSGNAVTDPNYFTAVADPTSKIANVGTATEPENILYQVLEKIIDYQTAKCYGNAIILVAKEGCSDDCDCSSKTGKSVKRIRTLLSVMRVSDIRQQYSQGEIAAREAERICSDCGCLER